MKKTLSINISTENTVLLGAFVFLLFYADSKVNTHQLYVSGEDNSTIKNDYIQRMKRALSANDYAVVKSMYKVKSAIDDIASDSFYVSSAQDNILSVVDEIRPYMSQKNKEVVENLLSGIDNTRGTLSRLKSSRQKIASVSPEGRNEKIKAVLEELPKVTGSDKLTEILRIKDALSVLRPIISSGKTPVKTEENAYSAEDSEEKNDELSEMMELIEMFDRKK